MDAQQQLVWNAEVSAAVLGNADGDVLVVDLDGALPSDLGAYNQRGFTWCGVMGFRNGQCTANLELTVEARACVVSASFQFAQLVAAKLNRPGDMDWLREKLAPKGDAVPWLERLMSLQDPRQEN